MRKGITLFAIFALALASLAIADVTKAPIRNLKFVGGANEPAAPAVTSPIQDRFPSFNSLDSVGTAYLAGTTWYDYQHNGSAGKMISTDNAGMVHVVWMNGLNQASSNRHVFYNYWDPAVDSFMIYNGIQIDGSSRGGYVTQATSGDGRCYPGFHQEILVDEPHAAASIDFLPQTGAYSGFEPCHLSDTRCGTPEDLQIIWPHITMDIDGKLHMVASESPCLPDAGAPQRIYYSRGTPRITVDGIGEAIDWEAVDGPDCFKEVDTVMVIAPDIAASRNTNRLVMAWAKSRDNLLIDDSSTQRNNDVVYTVSEDGGLTWGAEINITNFEEADWDCASTDTMECDKDTFRVYTDLNVMFDRNDMVHIVFTTSMYYSLEGTISRWASQIWHWGESTNEISPIKEWNPDSLIYANWALDIGDWQYILQRPNLCSDDITGDLYVSYQLCNDDQWSALNIPQTDAWVAKSVDCGRSWSAGVNVTESRAADGGQGTPAHQCACERDITLSETVTYQDNVGYLHMEYIFDRDAGGSIGDNPIGEPTLNPVVYRRIPISDVPAEPRWDHTFPQLHVSGLQVPYGGEPNPTFSEPCPPLGIEDHGRSTIPGSFVLYQNYPNPFNPSTQIQFDLAKNMNVTLSVFNVLGQEVATLLNNKALTAGTQVIEFDATNLPSGVYVYQMKANGLTQSHKMVLLK